MMVISSSLAPTTRGTSQAPTQCLRVDETRICIWTPDRSPIPSSSRSPHPLKLSTAIRTGHGANIFSAKFLPNAGTPTVVTVAGDHEIRLLEIERLSGTGEPGVERWAHGGTGLVLAVCEQKKADLGSVKVLKCHKDRTKRIATENSPFLFMTVSEDGTVRQHDLRRPHRCRSECPDPLFRAPQGVDLYSLSVSPVAPHIFAVAGRTDTVSHDLQLISFERDG
jgi:WD and tetratricopeptide repeat-containing protein 1